MEFKTFWKGLSVKEREDLADECETTFGHLRNVAYGSRPCGESLAIRIDKASKGQVTCEELCDDVDWSYIRGTRKSPFKPTTRRVG